jgi:hypothetical protein
MTEISTPPNLRPVAAGQPNQERQSAQTPPNRGGGPAPSNGRSAQVRKPLFRS